MMQPRIGILAIQCERRVEWWWWWWWWCLVMGKSKGGIIESSRANWEAGKESRRSRDLIAISPLAPALVLQALFCADTGEYGAAALMPGLSTVFGRYHVRRRGNTEFLISKEVPSNRCHCLFFFSLFSLFVWPSISNGMYVSGLPSCPRDRFL